MSDLRTTRKKLQVLDNTPALSIDEDGYVRVGLTEKMRENDKLILALYLCLKDESFKNKLLTQIDEQFVGKTTPTSRMVTAFDLVGR